MKRSHEMSPCTRHDRQGLRSTWLETSLMSQSQKSQSLDWARTIKLAWMVERERLQRSQRQFLPMRFVGLLSPMVAIPAGDDFPKSCLAANTSCYFVTCDFVTLSTFVLEIAHVRHSSNVLTLLSLNRNIEVVHKVCWVLLELYIIIIIYNLYIV